MKASRNGQFAASHQFEDGEPVADGSKRHVDDATGRNRPLHLVAIDSSQ